jgi:hypothetical protein
VGAPLPRPRPIRTHQASGSRSSNGKFHGWGPPNLDERRQHPVASLERPGGDFDPSWWDAHFQLLHDRGINATRIWISCSGDVGIEIDENGHVSGATPAYWSDLGRLLDIAQKHEVYVLATLMSFDHFKSDESQFQEVAKVDRHR